MSSQPISDELQTSIRYIARLSTEKFFGKLVLSFENGRITLLRREENLRPEALAGQQR